MIAIPTTPPSSAAANAHAFSPRVLSTTTTTTLTPPQSPTGIAMPSNNAFSSASNPFSPPQQHHVPIPTTVTTPISILPPNLTRGVEPGGGGGGSFSLSPSSESLGLSPTSREALEARQSRRISAGNRDQLLLRNVRFASPKSPRGLEAAGLLPEGTGLEKTIVDYRVESAIPHGMNSREEWERIGSSSCFFLSLALFLVCYVVLYTMGSLFLILRQESALGKSHLIAH
jgi:hypothetical protein